MRALGYFWAVVLVLLITGGVTLELLGPPRHPAMAGTLPTPEQARRVTASVHRVPPPPPAPGRSVGGPIAAPDPGLLEPVSGQAEGGLPQIDADGRMPMQVYARGFDPTDRRPRVAILLGGVGLNAAASEDAVRSLPGEISLAVSPYASNLTPLLQTVRTFGHEYLLAIPMEPEGYPLNDAGGHALLTAASLAENHTRLMWALGRIAGYVGTTSALDGLRGERLAAQPEQMAAVQAEIATRGLLYVDARAVTADPGLDTPTRAWSRRIDVVVDDPALRAEIEAKLARLEKLAREHGSALGLVGVIRPVTVEAVLTWSNQLAAHGIALAPVSAVMNPPAQPMPPPATVAATR